MIYDMMCYSVMLRQGQIVLEWRFLQKAARTEALYTGKEPNRELLYLYKTLLSISVLNSIIYICIELTLLSVPV